MAGLKLDGAGAQKMKTIEEALMTVQTLHGLVERMAMDVKNNKTAGTTLGAIKRIAVPLQGQLKASFGPIGDIVAAMILGLGRGGGDQVKVRTAREYIGMLRQALDFATNKVKKEHSVEIEISKD